MIMIGVVVDITKAWEVFDDVIEFDVGVLEQGKDLVESLNWDKAD